MTTLRAAVLALLEADSTLMAILTGGIHDRTEISRTATPSAFDDRGDLKPCAVLRFSTSVPKGTFDVAADTFFNLYYYQKKGGYASIDAAMARGFVLLNTTEDNVVQVAIDPGWVYEIRWADDFLDSWDKALDCPMAYSRYQVVQLRS